ncbi:hypothetical protein M0804_008098 [Polistes exclamans]|nr:hypothetical protein M0804_008098 [Polistes exclamans]
MDEMPVPNGSDAEHAAAKWMTYSILQDNTFPSFQPSTHLSGSTSSSSTIETVFLFPDAKRRQCVPKALLLDAVGTSPHCLGRDARRVSGYWLSSKTSKSKENIVRDYLDQRLKTSALAIACGLILITN